MQQCHICGDSDSDSEGNINGNRAAASGGGRVDCKTAGCGDTSVRANSEDIGVEHESALRMSTAVVAKAR